MSMHLYKKVLTSIIIHLNQLLRSTSRKLFYRNMLKEDHMASCILNRQYIHFDDDGIPERSESQKECEEYDDMNMNSKEEIMCFTWKKSRM